MGTLLISKIREEYPDRMMLVSSNTRPSSSPGIPVRIRAQARNIHCLCTKNPAVCLGSSVFPWCSL